MGQYLPGDLVRTKWGLAIITVAERNYAIWPLPGWKWVTENGLSVPIKYAWYSEDELELVELGPASIRLKSPTGVKQEGTI